MNGFFTSGLVPLRPAKSVAGGVANPPGKGQVARSHLGEDQPAKHFAIAVEGEAGVERQLHIVGAGQIPEAGRDIAGFIVDHQQRIVVEPVDAVQAQVERESGNMNRALGFGLSNLEGDARRFEVQPLGHQPCKPLLFQLQIAAGHNFAKMGTQLPRKDAPDVASDKALPVVQAQQFCVAANALRRAGPDGVKHLVQQVAALRWGQPGLCRLPILARRGARWRRP